MSGRWQLQEAKSRLSRVVEQARTEGPQTITVRGRASVVVLSIDDYQRLRGADHSLSDFFQRSPLRGVDLQLERDNDVGRDVGLE